jgi:hypothetical protein
MVLFYSFIPCSSTGLPLPQFLPKSLGTRLSFSFRLHVTIRSRFLRETRESCVIVWFIIKNIVLVKSDKFGLILLHRLQIIIFNLWFCITAFSTAMKKSLVLVKILGIRCLYAYPCCTVCHKKVREFHEGDKR